MAGKVARRMSGMLAGQARRTYLGDRADAASVRVLKYLPASGTR